MVEPCLNSEVNMSSCPFGLAIRKSNSPIELGYPIGCPLLLIIFGRCLLVAGSVKIITINFNKTGSIAPGEEVKVPVTVSPGKTGEIIGVNMHADGIAEATESTISTTAQQISLQLEDVKGEHNVPIMYANTKGDSVKNGINGNHFHFEESQVGKVFGQ